MVGRKEFAFDLTAFSKQDKGRAQNFIKGYMTSWERMCQAREEAYAVYTQPTQLEFYSPIVYLRPPKTMDFITECYGFHRNLGNMYALSDFPRVTPKQRQEFRLWLDDKAQVDLFRRKVGDFCLSDVMKLRTPLKEDNFDALDSMMKGDDNYAQAGSLEREVQEVMFLMATLPLARPGEVRVPGELQNLQRVLTDYFGGHLMRYLELRNADEDKLLEARDRPDDRPFLSHSLSAFAPAFLGLTPSSTLKLFQEVEHLVKGEHWVPRSDNQETELTYAYRLNGFAPELHNYQLYDYQADLRASKILVPYVNDQAQPDTQAPEVERFRRYEASLRADILRAPDKHLRLEIPDNPVIEGVKLTRHLEAGASNYSATNVFILMLRDGGHLTLELGGDGELYGIPVETLLEAPRAREVLGKVVLDSVNACASLRYPEVDAPKVAVKGATSIKQIQNLPRLRERDKTKKQNGLHPYSNGDSNGSSEAQIQANGVYRLEETPTAEAVRRSLGRNIPKSDLKRILKGMRDLASGKLSPDSHFGDIVITFTPIKGFPKR